MKIRWNLEGQALVPALSIPYRERADSVRVRKDLARVENPVRV